MRQPEYKENDQTIEQIHVVIQSQKSPMKITVKHSISIESDANDTNSSVQIRKGGSKKQKQSIGRCSLSAYGAISFKNVRNR